MKVLVIVKGNADSEAGKLPETELLEAMGKFNEEIVNAGILVSGEGLLPSAKGKRITFSAGTGEITTTDGPFPNPTELVAGFWVWKVASLQEAVTWAKKIPFSSTGGTIEVRQIASLEDFGENLTPELAAKETELRARVEGK